MNLPNEMVFPVNANHRSICRYPSNRDQTYRLVEAAIREIISGPALQPGKCLPTYLDIIFRNDHVVLT